MRSNYPSITIHLPRCWSSSCNVFRLRLLLLLLGMFASLPALAANIPKAVNYQGKLTDASGNPLPNGTYGIAIRLWDKKSSAEPTNTLIWGAEYNVTVLNGAFNIILGSGGTPLTNAAVNDIGFAFGDSERYFGITVTKGTNGLAIPNASEIVPRQQVLSVPNALMAQTAVSLLNPPVSIPPGLIAMWKGSVATIPSGWALCDGSNGSPDLRDKFVVGARMDGSGVAVTTIQGSPAQTGGSLSHTHSGTTSALGGGTTRIDDNSGGSDYDWQNPTGHSHTFTTDQAQNLPPYYSLAFIVKL